MVDRLILRARQLESTTRFAKLWGLSKNKGAYRVQSDLQSSRAL